MRVAVVGAGSWGTALAQTLASAGSEVRLWARHPAVAGALEVSRGLPAAPVVATGDAGVVEGVNAPWAGLILHCGLAGR